MSEIFYHSRQGPDAFNGDMKNLPFRTAMTLHPIKVPTTLYKLHHFFLSDQVKEEQRNKVERYRQMVRSTPEEELASLSPLTRRLGSPPKLSKFPVTEPEQVLAWAHIETSYALLSEKASDPRMTAAPHLLDGICDASSFFFEHNSSLSQLCLHERGRTLKQPRLNYAYYRVDPLHGVDMVLDMRFEYDRFSGRRLVQTVRRHVYLQQSFGAPEARSVKRQNTSTVVNVVVGVSDDMKKFERFCDNLEKIGLDGMRVIFVLHENDFTEEQKKSVVARLRQMEVRFGESISIVPTSVPFNRAFSLTLGANLLTDDDLILSMDIDVLFDADAIDSVRQFVIKGKQVYFPVVLSQYNPVRTKPGEATTNIPSRVRFNSGFGVGAFIHADLKAVYGMNLKINNCDGEIIYFAERLLKHLHNYTMVRAAEPGMVHVPDPNVHKSDLSQGQREACQGTYETLRGNVEQLAEQVHHNEKVLEVARARL